MMGCFTSNVAIGSCLVRPEALTRPLGPIKGENWAILDLLLSGDDFCRLLFPSGRTRSKQCRGDVVQHFQVPRGQ